MSVLVNLRHVETRDLAFKGELTPAELAIEHPDEMVQANQPLRYDLTVDLTGENLLVDGSLEMVLDCCCVRCLKPLTYPIKLTGHVCILPLDGEDKIEVVGECVDLTPYLREHILLEFPPHPVCQPDCGGLPIRAGQRPKVREPSGSAGGKPSPWDELSKLQL
jgi:uncharacterized protein